MRSYQKPGSEEVTTQERYLEKWRQIPKKSGKLGKMSTSEKKETVSEGKRAWCVSQYVLENYLSWKVCAC